MEKINLEYLKDLRSNNKIELELEYLNLLSERLKLANCQTVCLVPHVLWNNVNSI